MIDYEHCREQRAILSNVFAWPGALVRLGFPIFGQKYIETNTHWTRRILRA